MLGMPLENHPPIKHESSDVTETFISINSNFNLPSSLVILYDAAHTSMIKNIH
jgi:hypothetical protein